MNIIRILGNRVPAMVRFAHGFKKPPPMYKRRVVPSDFDVENIKCVKQLKKMYRVLISMSIIFILAVIPVLSFNVEYLKLFFK